MIDFLLGGVISWLAERVVGMLSQLVSFLAAAFFSSPDVTGFPQVRALSTMSSTVVNSMFLLAIIAAGAIGMTHGTFQIRYQVKDLMPRLVSAWILSNVGVTLCGILIEIANAVMHSLVGTTASGTKVLTFVKARIVSAMSDPSCAILAVVVGLIIIVLVYMLVVSWFTRIATLIVLAGLAPLALACYALPYTQPVATLWWRALLGCLATPVLQGVFFSSGVNLLLDQNFNIPIVLGIGFLPSVDVMNLFIAASILMITVRIPAIVGRYAMRSASTSPASIVLRAVAVNAFTRHLRLPMGSRLR